MLDSRIRDDLSDDPERTTRVCARFELTHGGEESFDSVLTAFDQPLIVPRSDALPRPRGDLATERAASFMQFVDVPTTEFSARSIEAPEPGLNHLVVRFVFNTVGVVGSSMRPNLDGGVGSRNVRRSLLTGDRVFIPKYETWRGDGSVPAG